MQRCQCLIHNSTLKSFFRSSVNEKSIFIIWKTGHFQMWFLGQYHLCMESRLELRLQSLKWNNLYLSVLLLIWTPIYLNSSIHLYSYSSIHLCIYTAMYLAQTHISKFIYSSIHVFIYVSNTNPSIWIHLFMYSSIQLFIYSSIHLFIYSFIHLFIYTAMYLTQTHIS